MWKYYDTKISSTTKKTGEGNKNGIKHSWPKGTCVVIGDSMVTGIDEHKMSSKRLIKVRSFPGAATCSHMYYYLVPILKRKLEHVILHVGTNGVANYEGTEIVDKLLELKSFISELLELKSLITNRTYSYISSNHEN